MTSETTNPSALCEERTTWKIRIAGYGTFDFEGTEAEAEERRIAKAQWEHASSMMWRADLTHPLDKLRSEQAAIWDSGEGICLKWLRKRKKELGL